MSERETQCCTVAVVLESSSARCIGPVSDDDALTLVWCAADDPASWDDVSIIWPRYAEDETPSVDALPSQQIGTQMVSQRLAGNTRWVALDLPQRRILTGHSFFPLQHLDQRRSDDLEDASPVLHPPWWELLQQVTIQELLQPRQSPLSIPQCPRDFLWGTPLSEYFADQLLAVAKNQKRWNELSDEGDQHSLYDATVRIHKNWLMSPHPALDGGIPRDCLHGGREWIEKLVDLQCQRVFRRQDPVPVTESLSGFATAPMGLHETVIYFDACREMLNFGWMWMRENAARLTLPESRMLLAQALQEFLQAWRRSPFEGPESPDEVVLTERLRIPLVQGSGHIIDCNCPICSVMASEFAGPSICMFDGYSLEMDNEFAFSLCRTREEWESEQLYSNFDPDDDDDDADSPNEQPDWKDDNKDDVDDPHSEILEDETEELRTPWQSPFLSSEGLPGDAAGHLGLAFQLAEIVAELQTIDGISDEVRLINDVFRRYLSASTSNEQVTAAADLSQLLETAAARHPHLVGRAADLQSRFDENLRLHAARSNPD